MTGLLQALQFLTRLPGLSRLDYHAQHAGAAVAWYPLVGLLIGGLLLAAQWLFGQQLALESSVLACVLLIIWVWITGALHLDGLADCADALMGAFDRERFLDILKDTHAGVAAIVAVVLVLLMKFASLGALLGNTPTAALLLPPVIARILMAWLLVLTPYLRNQGLGADVKQHANPANLAISSVIVLAIVTWLMPLHSCVALAAGILGAIGVFTIIVRRIGGATGDVYGATVEVCEAACLFALVLLL